MYYTKNRVYVQNNVIYVNNGENEYTLSKNYTNNISACGTVPRQVLFRVTF